MFLIINWLSLSFSDFSLSYYRRDLNTESTIENDCDLDIAYLKSSRPFLQITLLCHKNNSLPDWDIITIADITRTQNASSIANSLINQVSLSKLILSSYYCLFKLVSYVIHCMLVTCFRLKTELLLEYFLFSLFKCLSFMQLNDKINLCCLNHIYSKYKLKSF